MVGFPGETEAEFRETYELIASLPFSYLHLFPFSPRPGTRGWEMHKLSPVPPQIVSERMSALRDLATEKSRRFRASFVGRTLPAITLHSPATLTAQGRTLALSDNYLPLELTQELAANQLVDVRVTEINAGGVLVCAMDSVTEKMAVAS